MWDQPYLETCCRSALHRMILCGDGVARPAGMKDGPCLDRLCGLGFARHCDDGGFEVTEAGRRRHASEILSAA